MLVAVVSSEEKHREDYASTGRRDRGLQHPRGPRHEPGGQRQQARQVGYLYPHPHEPPPPRAPGWRIKACNTLGALGTILVVNGNKRDKWSTYTPTVAIPLEHVLGAEADPELERPRWRAGASGRPGRRGRRGP